MIAFLRRLFVCLTLVQICAHADSAGLIDAGVFDSDAAAREAWVAKEGSPPAAARTVAGRPALALSCPFTHSKLGRVVWDREVALDLSRAEAVELEIYCPQAGPISSFTLYFKSGGGWYSGAFSPRVNCEWETITVRKDDVREEGKPAGWAHVSGLRLAAWRGDREDTEFFIRNLRRTGVLGEDTHIIVAAPGGAKSDAQFAQNVSTILGDLGLRHAMLPEAELTADVLAKSQLVILPYNPDLPAASVTALAEYLGKGGRLLAFYALPAALEKVTGIAQGRHVKPERDGQFSSIHPAGDALSGAPAATKQASWNIVATQPVAGRSRMLAEWHDAEGKPTGYPAILASDNTVFMTHVLLDDDRANKQRLLLAMVGLGRGEFWKTVIATHRQAMEHIGPQRSFEALVASLQAYAPAQQTLQEATRLRSAADEALGQGKFAEALASVDGATRKAREAFALAQTSKPGEFRAVWCHSAYGVKGLTWDESIACLKASGFTAIMPNMLWGGVSYYPSEVLPVAAEIASKGDQLAACVAACQKYGVQIHVWKVDWNLGHDVPAAFVDKLRAEKRLQQSFDGIEQPWLCPSNPENLKLERESLLEVARRYPIDGIHFDYIRYPDAEHCFCRPCRERFEKATGKTVAQWPRDVQVRGSRRAEWVTWCQGNITALVESVSNEVRKVRPGIKISAAVFRNWDVDRAIVMQDWKLWCERGYLDFVCPMDYTNNDGTYETWVRQQKIWAGPAQLCPGIGASSSHSALAADQVIDQIEITRRHESAGFIIFNYGEREANELLPILRMGATKP
ncbi:MAG: family 10 glycosylhydrolase [Chthoniobacteraceae bacterium]